MFISAQSPEKLPADKVAGVVDSKVGVATCITKRESINDDERCETLVKHAASLTPGRNVDVPQPSAVHETELKQIGSSSSPSAANNMASIHSAEGCVSLHRDGSLPTTGKEVQQPPHQDRAGLESAGTCSNNCASSSVSSDFSQFSMDILLVCFLTISTAIL